MEALRSASSVPSLNNILKAHGKTHFTKPNFINFHRSTHPTLPSWSLSSSSGPFKVFTISSPSTISTADSPLDEAVLTEDDEKFDWFSEWYPIMPICDLDKRVPHGKKVLGLDIVVWWDKNESAWKVFDDACPHRLAPLSDGRIDKLGRLQCSYHGWCFNASGECKLIPQAAPDGPPVHTFKKACARVYPSIVHHEMVWFWPNTDAEYKDIMTKKKPPFIPEMDDPSFLKFWINRDFPYGYEVLVENLMDPAHVPYAHYGIMDIDQPPKVKVDREGGKPLDIGVEQIDINGFFGNYLWDDAKFVAPCTYYNYNNPAAFKGLDYGRYDGPPPDDDDDEKMKKLPEQRRTMVFYFFPVPVGPGKSRLIWGLAKNFETWIDKIIPRWILHMGPNLVVDSDLHLLHIEERKIMEVGLGNWHKACFVPTKSDAYVVAFRRWLNKYSDGQINWGGKFSSATLPPPPPREQLMDRYWSHVVNCRSCSSAYKSLNALEIILQVISVISIGIAAATKQSVMSAAAMVTMSVIGFAASKWLAHFIHNNFHYQDYDHTLH